MLKFTKKLFGKHISHKNKSGNFFDLSSREQKKILNEAVKGANKDQLELVKKYKEEMKLKECAN